MTADDGVATTLLGRRVRLYDLSQEVSQNTQVHPLHPRTEVYPYESHANSAAALGTGFSYRASPRSSRGRARRSASSPRFRRAEA